MHWPVVLIVVAATKFIAGMVHDESRPEGYQKPEDCKAFLPVMVEMAREIPKPDGLGEVIYIPGCIQVPPDRFFEDHIKTKPP